MEHNEKKRFPFISSHHQSEENVALVVLTKYIIDKVGNYDVILHKHMMYLSLNMAYLAYNEAFNYDTIVF
jgi:hypothetical protein